MARTKLNCGTNTSGNHSPHPCEFFTQSTKVPCPPPPLPGHTSHSSTYAKVLLSIFLQTPKYTGSFTCCTISSSSSKLSSSYHSRAGSNREAARVPSIFDALLHGSGAHSFPFRSSKCFLTCGPPQDVPIVRPEYIQDMA